MKPSALVKTAYPAARGLGAIEMFAQILPGCAPDATHRRRFAGHGRTAILTALSSYEARQMTSPPDTHLGFEQVDIMGYSLGQARPCKPPSDHPPLIRRLVYISASTNRMAGIPKCWLHDANGPASAEPMSNRPFTNFTPALPRP